MPKQPTTSGTGKTTTGRIVREKQRAAQQWELRAGDEFDAEERKAIRIALGLIDEPRDEEPQGSDE